MRRCPAALVVAALAVTAAGCGERQIDVEESATLIERAVEEQVGADVGSVSCPDEVKLRAKATFTCAVVGRDGTRGDATVTQTDGEGAVSVAAPFLHKDEAEQTIQAELRKRAPRTTVECPDIIVVKAGGRFRCEADLGPLDASVEARQTNAQGNFVFSVKQRE